MTQRLRSLPGQSDGILNVFTKGGTFTFKQVSKLHLEIKYFY